MAGEEVREIWTKFLSLMGLKRKDLGMLGVEGQGSWSIVCVLRFWRK